MHLEFLGYNTLLSRQSVRTGEQLENKNEQIMLLQSPMTKCIGEDNDEMDASYFWCCSRTWPISLLEIYRYDAFRENAMHVCLNPRWMRTVQTKLQLETILHRKVCSGYSEIGLQLWCITRFSGTVHNVLKSLSMDLSCLPIVLYIYIYICMGCILYSIRQDPRKPRRPSSESTFWHILEVAPKSDGPFIGVIIHYVFYYEPGENYTTHVRSTA